MKILKLTVFLAVVGALAGGLLSFVNSITEPIIEAQGMAAELANLEVIFPDAEFEEIEFVDESGLIENGYVAVDQGYAFKAAVIGYNSGFPIEFLIGFDLDGNIAGFEVLAQQETNGLGSKITETEFKDSVVSKTVNDNIDVISGATVTSNAVIEGINAAKVIYAEVAGVEVSTEQPTAPEKPIIKLSDDFSSFNATLVSEADGVYSISAEGFEGTNVYEITVVDGVIATVMMSEFNDTPGYGDKVTEDYLNTFVGADLNSEVDVVAGASATSKSAFAAMKLALEESGAVATGNTEDTSSEALFSTDKVTVMSVDGDTYSVTSEGFEGAIVLDITVSNGEIKDIVVVEHGESIPTGVNEMPGRILENGIEADVVAGTTYSSEAIKAAVQAVLDYSASSTTTEDTSSEALFSTDKVTVMSVDGDTYSVTSEGFEGAIVLDITVSNGEIKDIVVVEHGESIPTGVNEMPGRILENGIEADVVAGTTYSSEAIKAAVQAVLDYIVSVE